MRFEGRKRMGILNIWDIGFYSTDANITHFAPPRLCAKTPAQRPDLLE